MGFAAYCAFMWLKFDDPLVYFHGQKLWDRRLRWFWGLFSRNLAGLQPFYQIWFFASVAAAFGLLAIGVLLRLPRVYVIFGLTSALFMFLRASLKALPRYSALSPILY